MKTTTLILSAILLAGSCASAYADNIRPDGKGGYRITDEKGRVKGYIDPVDKDTSVIRRPDGKVKGYIQSEPKSDKKRRQRDADESEEE